MYKIGELSKFSGIPVKTLRYYDNEGILSADKIDDFTGYRYYSAEKLSVCYRILALKELGFSLFEIKQALALSKEKFFELIAVKQQELENLLKQTETRINSLRKLNLALKEREFMFDIVIRKSDVINIAYYRQIVKEKADFDIIFDKMKNNIPREIIGNRQIIIDYETEFITQDFDTGFGIEITGVLPEKSNMIQKSIEFTTDTASLICSKENCDEATKQLHKYVLDGNYQIVGPTYKIIYTDGTIEVKLPITKLGEYSESFNENIDVPFENDSEVIGHWMVFDGLPCKEMFNPQKSKTALSDNLVQELYFLPSGERYWCFGWTKGWLLSNCGYPHRKSRNKYTVEKIDEDTFMFIEFKTYDYFRGGMPEILVLKKIDSKAYTKYEIMKTDAIPNVPADDINIIGKWNVCDLVRSPDSFNPDNMCEFVPHDALYWRNAEFLTGGNIINTFKLYQETETHTDEPHVWRWVNDYVICSPRQTASKYIIQIHNNIEFLFIEWKSGDYSYGGEKPFWYVFKRA